MIQSTPEGTRFLDEHLAIIYFFRSKTMRKGKFNDKSIFANK